MRHLFICIFILTLPSLVVSQKGFQFGLGITQQTTNNETKKYFKEDKISISNLYGASLNLDYSFSHKFKIKSGLEYKIQNVNFENLTKFKAEYLSIPIIFNYNFLQLEKQGLSFGIDAGISWDKPVFLTIDLQKNSKILIDKETITTLKLNPSGLPSRVFEYNDYLSLRLGITAKYNLGQRGQLNFFAHSTNLGFKGSIPYEINEKVMDQGTQISNETIKNSLNLSNKGLQFGLYYTFGTLTFK